MNVDALTARLVAAGIDPAVVLEHGAQPLVAHAEKREVPPGPWLDALATYVESLQRMGAPSFWSPLRFCVPQLARVAGTDPARFQALLQQTAELLEELARQNTDSVRTEQYGLPTMARAFEGQPRACERTLQLALALAKRRAEPGWLLQLAVPVLWEAAGKGPAAFSHLLDVLERTALSLHAAKVHVGYPFATAVAALAKRPRVQDHFEGWLERVRRIGQSLAGGQGGPYATFEHGIAIFLDFEPLTPEEVTALLDLGVTLADRGLNAARVLEQSRRAFTSPPLTPGRFAELAMELTQEGIDPYFPLGFGAPALSSTMEPVSCELFLARLMQLTRDLHQAERSGDQFFSEGLPVLLQLEHERGFTGIFERGFALAEQMARRGLSPGVTVTHGIGRALARIEPGRPEVALCFDAATALVETGYAPYPMLAYAFGPLVALAGGREERLREMLETLRRLVATLLREGIDPHDVLFHDVRELADAGGEAHAFIDLLGRVERLFEKLSAAGLDPKPMATEGLATAARQAKGRPWLLIAALETAERMAEQGRDPTALFTRSLEAVAQSAGDDATAFAALLTSVEQRFAQFPVDLIGPATTAACRVAGTRPEVLGEILEKVAERFGGAARTGDPRSEIETQVVLALPVLAELADSSDALFQLTDALLAALDTLKAHRPVVEAWVRTGLPSLVTVSAKDPSRALALIPQLAQAATTWEPYALALTFGADGAARLSVGAPERFLELLGVIDQAARSLLSGAHPVRSTGALLERTLKIANTVAQHATEFRAVFAQLMAVLDPHQEDAQLPQMLEIVQALVERHPEAWVQVVAPTLAVQGRPAAVLDAVWGISRWHVRRASDLELLREIITQEGVRAAAILENLVLAGLSQGVIRDLSAERELVLRFVREVGIFEPTLLLEYQRIWNDPTLALGEKQSRSGALVSKIAHLTARIRQGEVGPDEERDPLLAAALIRTFPPAVSGGKERYLALYQALPDHPEHVDQRDPGPALRSRAYRLARGSWQVRTPDGWDRSLWDRLTALVQALPESAPAPAAELGFELLSAWTDGRIGRDATRWPLLARLLATVKAGGAAFPAAAQTAPELIAHRELLADKCRDTLETLLLAARAQAPERYERLVRGKLLPKPKIGTGLVRGVAQTLQGLREGRLEKSAALHRLEGQLQAFEVDPEALCALEGLEPTDVRTALEALPPRAQTLEAGKEVSRLHADFLGPVLQRMHDVLFGAKDAPGCLVYRLASDPLPLQFELTKRRAHAAVGLTEGVCVAEDVKLWNTPTFLQTVLWSPDGVARGGFHLLRVEDADGGYLALPGINPSSSLLKEVGAGPVLDAVVDYAWRLARAWDLRGVWLPAQPGIHSNRHEIHLEIASRGWAVRHVRRHPFSFSPYSYSFEEVLVVPERYLPETDVAA